MTEPRHHVSEPPALLCSTAKEKPAEHPDIAFLSVENYNAINGWGTAQRPSCSLRGQKAEVTSNRCYIYPPFPLSLALCPIQLCTGPIDGEVSHVYQPRQGPRGR